MNDIRAIDAYEAYKRLIAGYYNDDRDMQFDTTLLNEYFLQEMRKEGIL